MNPDTLILGGISTNIWIWSGHTSAYTICTPFQSHISCSIFPIYALFCPYKIFRVYFGANTMWYLQFQLVCAKLLLSCIADLLLLSLCSCQTALILYQKEYFCVPLKLFWTPDTIRGFRLTEKNPDTCVSGFSHWRRHPDSNWGIGVLQTRALPLGYDAD